jgi:hypothetical protein
MKLKRSTRQTVTRIDALDAQMDSYLRWRAQSRRVVESYRTWERASESERELAFTRYLAALDREEFAARDYRRTLGPVAAV